MFESMTPSPPPARATPKIPTGRLGRRALWGALAVGSLAVGIAGGAAFWAWGKALSTDCKGIAKADLTMTQLIALKRRLSDYQQHASEAAANIQMSGDEMSFYVSQQLDIRARLAFEGDRLVAKVIVPARNTTCYPVDFTGQVTVSEGVATVTPTSLKVGSLDLSPVAAGLAFEITADQLEGKAALLLANTEDLKVAGDKAYVRLDDPKRVW